MPSCVWKAFVIPAPTAAVSGGCTTRRNVGPILATPAFHLPASPLLRCVEVSPQPRPIFSAPVHIHSYAPSHPPLPATGMHPLHFPLVGYCGWLLCLDRVAILQCGWGFRALSALPCGHFGGLLSSIDGLRCRELIAAVFCSIHIRLLSLFCSKYWSRTLSTLCSVCIRR